MKNPQELARELAPLVAKEVIHELEKQTGVHSLGELLRSLPYQSTSVQKLSESKEELEKWATQEAKQLLSEMRQKAKNKSTLNHRARRQRANDL